MFWGARFLDEALQSIGNSINLALPRIAITDQPTASAMVPGHPFDEIVLMRPGPHSLLLKADLYRYLPEAYESFLFLDTDATVIADVSLGFEKAEIHAIAASMAPHYSLDKYGDFRRVMEEIGVRCAGQMQYNTGVLFFRRGPDTDSVMRRWAELALDLGPRLAFFDDQPFLTLAMELLGFKPYTLSPSYNYRALGELASGDIRIWHSHAPFPSSLNVYNASWPPRRFHGSTVANY